MSNYYWVLKDKRGDAFAVAISTTAPERVVSPNTFLPVDREHSFKHPVVMAKGAALTVIASYDYKLITKEDFETLLAFEAVPQVVFRPGPVCWEPIF